MHIDRTRRWFLRSLGAICAAWLGTAVYPIYRFLSPQPAPDPFGEDGRALAEGVAPAAVAQPGSGVNGAYGGRGLIVFRKPDGELRAFDSKCTHAGCNVQFQGDRIYCNCHGGTYDLDGRNVAGPPPKPLTELRVIEESGAVFVSRLGDGEREGA